MKFLCIMSSKSDGLTSLFWSSAAFFNGHTNSRHFVGYKFSGECFFKFTFLNFFSFKAVIHSTGCYYIISYRKYGFSFNFRTTERPPQVYYLHRKIAEFCMAFKEIVGIKSRGLSGWLKLSSYFIILNII